MKRELRDRFRTTLAALSREEIEAKSNAAAQNLFESKAYQNANTLMVFVSLSSEIDTTPIVLRAWQDRKRVLVPRLSWQQRRILPIETRSLTDAINGPRFGIHEASSGPPAPIGTIDLVLVPGLAFDKYGNRLGRGRGFYDRFLASSEFNGLACALAFEEQVTESLPVSPHDRPVHMLVTDQKLRRFRRPASS
jgi:5-formyltetrahydrofolate cyclo-ligase